MAVSAWVLICGAGGIILAATLVVWAVASIVAWLRRGVRADLGLRDE